MKIKEWILTLLSAAVLSGAAPTAAQEKEVLAAMDAWIQATVNQDIAGLQRILHDELVYTHSAATTQTKAEVIKDVQEGRGPAGIELTGTTIRVYDNTALVKSMVIVRGRTRNQGQGEAGKRSGNQGPMPLYIMHVLVKGPQGWQVVSRQATRPTPPPTASNTSRSR